MIEYIFIITKCIACKVVFLWFFFEFRIKTGRMTLHGMRFQVYPFSDYHFILHSSKIIILTALLLTGTDVNDLPVIITLALFCK